MDTAGADGKLIGVLRTMTAPLVTTAAQLCIDAIPIPAFTNEMGWFRQSIDELLAAYDAIDLFRRVAADAGNCSEANARYVHDKGLHYLSPSAPPAASSAGFTSPCRWLRLIRSLWGVENAVHCTADKLMHEDQHPWIEADPKGALIVTLRRRVVYNLLALFRPVILRAQGSRCTPWKTLMRWVEMALPAAEPDDVARLRPRIAADARAL